MRILLTTILLFICSTTYAEGAAQQKTQIWEDGTKYVGEVINGKREGKGTIIWSDGSRYTGYFKNDLRNGPGTMILPDGTVYNGYFVDDELTDPPATEPQPEPQPDLQVAAGPSEEPVTKAANVLPPVNSMTDEVNKELRSTLSSWSAAWSEQNEEQYLAKYSDEFAVPGRLSRNQWELLRRSRIKRPERISVSLEFKELQIIDTNMAEVRLRQDYRSNLYQDTTEKLFKLQRGDNGDWKILSERVIN